MILGKQYLRNAIAMGRIQLHDDHGATLPEWEPILRGEVGAKDPIGLQPASIDLHLGNQWMVPRPNSERMGVGVIQGRKDWVFLDCTDAQFPVEYGTIVSDNFEIPAHGFVLVRTKEVIGIHETLFGKIEGRSSVGRLGLIVETAGVVDPGFYGSITLELQNCLPNPLRVYSGMRGCQLVVSQVLGSTEGGYQSAKYQGQVATTGTRLYKDFEGREG